jgi:hypothetical protein
MDLAQKVKENESGVVRIESRGKILCRPLIILQFSYQIFEELGSEGARVFVLEESCTSDLVVEKLRNLLA